MPRRPLRRSPARSPRSLGGGDEIEAGVADDQVRPWSAHEIAMRMLNNLVASYQRRGDLGAATRAASMRLELPAEQS